MSVLPYCDPTKRIDFSIDFGVRLGNPNGDPDAPFNTPRIDTMGYGLVSDVSIKSKIRDTVMKLRGDESPNRIYITRRRFEALSTVHAKVYDSVDSELKELAAKKENYAASSLATNTMCSNFWDVRMFGGALSACNVLKRPPMLSVTGPMQILIGVSRDIIDITMLGCTRQAVTKVDEMFGSEASEKKGERGSLGTMMNRGFLSYARYRMDGFFSPTEAARTGVTTEDLKLFWEALHYAFENDHAQARGALEYYGSHVFIHDHQLGSAPSRTLFNLVSVIRKEGVAPDCVRQESDYMVSVKKEVPNGVTYCFVE